MGTRQAVIQYEIDRMMKRVAQKNSCWEWTGAMHKGGYGRTTLAGRPVTAHRALYELLVGDIPEGLVLDHLCRVRHCVNPDHLEPVTQRVNILRGVGISARNSEKVCCPKGHELVQRTDKHPRRYCKVCNRDREALRRSNGMGSA